MTTPYRIFVTRCGYQGLGFEEPSQRWAEPGERLAGAHSGDVHNAPFVYQKRWLVDSGGTQRPLVVETWDDDKGRASKMSLDGREDFRLPDPDEAARPKRYRVNGYDWSDAWGYEVPPPPTDWLGYRTPRYGGGHWEFAYPPQKEKCCQGWMVLASKDREPVGLQNENTDAEEPQDHPVMCGGCGQYHSTDWIYRRT